MADEGESPLEQRVERLETGQENTNSKLDEVLALVRRLTGGAPVTHERAEQQTEDRLDRPSSAEGYMRQITRDELARAAKEHNDTQERETIAQRLARLEEKRPEPPQPRREKIMWGGR